MVNRKPRRKALPALGLGSPDVGDDWPGPGCGDPLAALAAPSVPAAMVSLAW